MDYVHTNIIKHIGICKVNTIHEKWYVVPSGLVVILIEGKIIFSE